MTSGVSFPESPAGYDVSVIVPTRDRPRRLQSCLTALATQTLDSRRFEVIIVDDGSATSLASVVEPFSARLQLTLIEQRNAGPACARNAGAVRARGAFLAFTDDDCEPQPEWLSVLLTELRRQPDSICGGHTVNALSDSVLSEASQLLIDFLYHSESKHDSGDQAPGFFTSNNFALRASLFGGIGGFDESFRFAAGEDREICERWRRRGYGLVRTPDAIVKHSHALSLRAFWRQHFNYGRGACRLRRLRSADGLSRGLESCDFYWRLVSYPLRTRGRSSRMTLTALLAVSQLATALGFLVEHRASVR